MAPAQADAPDCAPPPPGEATFVGFGFGAIQAGLFLLEAQRSQVFRHLVVAEIVPDLVDAVRRAGGRFHVNVAHLDRVNDVTVGPVRIENPYVDADRARLVEAVAAAQEIATAVPSTRFYISAEPGSLHRILAEGLRRKVAIGGPSAVIYAAENDPHAAAQLEAAVLGEIHAADLAAVRARVRFVDTVIGKMSGVVTLSDSLGADSLTADSLAGLAPIIPTLDRAFLVEAFNRILIAPPNFGPDVAFRRGITVFVEQADLAPFEDAKFFGHNATHALAAYLARFCGLVTMDQLASQPGLMAFVRAALVEEVGAGLLQRHAGRDPLFTPAGFARYADDLLPRMVNPYLRDQVARVARDPARKLGWHDRLLGAMRLARDAGVIPHRYALAAAAALDALDPEAVPAVLLDLWREAQPPADVAAALLALIETARQRLLAWRAAGFPDLAAWWRGCDAPLSSPVEP